jgi:hypothetical protein
MGTKGFVAVTLTGNIDNNTMILGVRSDGFLFNLNKLANDAMKAARSERVLTNFRNGDKAAVKRVFKRVCEMNNDWCFIDIAGNAQWVSYSVTLNPKTGKVTMWEGSLEYPYTPPNTVPHQTT